jgi:hypothetical protein
MRAFNVGEFMLMISQQVSHHLMIQVQGGDGLWRNLAAYEGANWIERVSWEENQDTPCATANIVLRREIGSVSLSPAAYPLGQAPLAPGSRIAIYTAVAPTGNASVSWRLMFLGVVDDLAAGGDTSEITLRCRDMAARLIDASIESPIDPVLSTAGASLKEVIQNMANQSIGIGWVTVEGPDGPTIAPFVQPSKRLFLAQRDVALASGYDLRYRADATGKPQLTLFPVDRTATGGMASFGTDNYQTITDATTSSQSVCNVIEVFYTDAAGRSRSVKVSDQDSIKAYGRRYLSLGSAPFLAVKTADDALVVANAALADLKEPPTQYAMRMLYFWPVQLHDRIGIAQDLRLGTPGYEVSVIGYRHEYASGTTWTTLQTSAKPSVGRAEWTRRATPTMAA